MNIRNNVLKLILLIVILLFLWQIILILIVIIDHMHGIDDRSYDINLLNKSRSTIPRLIHQMWKSENLNTYPINNSYFQWKKMYPDYKIRLWTDKDLENLLLTNDYKYLYSIYKSYIYSIQRADLGRLIILHAQGGIYADLDVFPCSEQVEKLRLSNVSLIIPRSTSGSSVINHFLIAQKSSPILNYILHEIVPLRFYKRIFLLPYLEVFSTGSFFLTRTLKKYIQLSNEKKEPLWILSDDNVNNYVHHYTGRSWHFVDGFILNQFQDKIEIRIIFSFIIFILFIIIWKYRTHFDLCKKFKGNSTK
ncbi:unnamed protein product [Adineta steineri]|uniref:Uncharacterized protein n=1 Tax=Adineta steineri TaxID=433720 RepID=A0A813YAV9_9BILA|nr:unnamed protein product [Adineta steineri]CAF3500035.1 unnamed protein product [Adineta steineri]